MQEILSPTFLFVQLKCTESFFVLPQCLHQTQRVLPHDGVSGAGPRVVQALVTRLGAAARPACVPLRLREVAAEVVQGRGVTVPTEARTEQNRLSRNNNQGHRKEGQGTATEKLLVRA